MADPFIVKPEQRTKYEAMFNQNKDSPMSMTGSKARELFTKSGLAKEDLSKIWKLSDQDANGELNLEEFVVAAHLISVAVNKLAQIPDVIPGPLVLNKGAGFSNPPFMMGPMGGGMTAKPPPTIPDFPTPDMSRRSSTPGSSAMGGMPLGGPGIPGMLGGGPTPPGGPGAMPGLGMMGQGGPGGMMGMGPPGFGGPGGPVPNMAGGLMGMGIGGGPGGMTPPTGAAGMMGPQAGFGGFPGGPPAMGGAFGGPGLVSDPKEAEFSKDATRQSENIKNLIQDLSQMEQTIFDRRRTAEERKAKMFEMKQFEAKLNLQLMQAKQELEQAQKLSSDGETALVQLNTLMEVSKNNLRSYEEQLNRIKEHKIEIDEQLLKNRAIAESMDSNLLAIQGHLQAQEEEINRQRRAIEEAEGQIARLRMQKQGIEVGAQDKMGEMSRLNVTADGLRKEIANLEQELIKMKATQVQSSSSGDADRAIVNQLMGHKEALNAEFVQLQNSLIQQERQYQEKNASRHPDIETLQALYRQAKNAVHEFSTRINICYTATGQPEPRPAPTASRDLDAPNSWDFAPNLKSAPAASGIPASKPPQEPTFNIPQSTPKPAPVAPPKDDFGFASTSSATPDFGFSSAPAFSPPVETAPRSSSPPKDFGFNNTAPFSAPATSNDDFGFAPTATNPSISPKTTTPTSTNFDFNAPAPSTTFGNTTTSPKASNGPSNLSFDFNTPAATFGSPPTNSNTMLSSGGPEFGSSLGGFATTNNDFGFDSNKPTTLDAFPTTTTTTAAPFKADFPPTTNDAFAASNTKFDDGFAPSKDISFEPTFGFDTPFSAPTTNGGGDIKPATNTAAAGSWGDDWGNTAAAPAAADWDADFGSANTAFAAPTKTDDNWGF